MNVLVVTAMWPSPKNPAFGSFIHSQVQHLRQAGINVETLVLGGHLRKLIYPKGIWELHKRLGMRTFHLVHAHYGYVGWVARTQWRLPIVVTYHGDDALGTVDVRGRTRAFSRVAASFCRRLGPLVDAVIVQTKEMERRFGCSNVHVVPHEVDFDLFRLSDKKEARHILGLADEKKYILFAANPDTAVKRFPLAKATVEHLKLRDSSVELLVIFKEPQTRLALYMNACDALVFPSWQEGSPNIVKQAMACNLPIVATDAGDVREVIDGVAGCHICDPTVEDFARRLGEILQNPKRTAGREKVQGFAGPVVAQRVIGVYESTLRRRANTFSASAQIME
jgi:teichuronic acid biosynthesis glycosyltransferase TuaC